MTLPVRFGVLLTFRAFALRQIVGKSNSALDINSCESKSQVVPLVGSCSIQLVKKCLKLCEFVLSFYESHYSLGVN